MTLPVVRDILSGRLITDTSDFLSITYGDCIEIGGRRYTILGHEYERRFGIDDPKYWVRRALDQETGEKKIIKLSFAESFETYFHRKKITYFRDAHKEARILELCKTHPSFVKGSVHCDQMGNIIRILDLIPGPNFLMYVDSLDMEYESYLQAALPDIFKKLIVAFEAIGFLHTNGFKHGDIRNDHIIVDSRGNGYLWIDFDYDYKLKGPRPFALEVMQLGNILINAIGKGFYTIQTISADLKKRLAPQDFSLLHRRRFVNLKKLYPFIPEPLNDMLMRFSVKASQVYDSVEQLIHDMNQYLQSVQEG